MGRMKEHFHDEITKHQQEGWAFSSSQGPDDTDWNASELLEPAEDNIDPVTGKKMWVIKGYKIWAHSYKQAMELLPMIENF